ncbi:MAG TPA: CvpA family protein [Gaiellaceae bacterium]
MTFADLLVILLIAASAVYGAARGFALQAISLAGLALGAFAGSRIAPHLLSEGTSSTWVPVASLIGAVVGALLLQAAATAVAAPLVTVLARGPVRAVDAVGGAVLGAALGLALAWLFAVVALQQPALGLRQTVQRSAILPGLLHAAPPTDVLNALGRFDPLPLVGGLPGTQLPPPDPSVRSAPGARRAQRSVVKVLGTSCGLGVEGSGWIVAPGLVATNVHVVTGEEDTHVLVPDGRDIGAIVVHKDPKNDIAILRVAGLSSPALRPAPDDDDDRKVVLLGYPNNGPLKAAPGTAGPPRRALGQNAFGRGPVLRELVPLRGAVRHGDSGGPVVDSQGRVVAMMFAATRGSDGGLGIPVDLIEDAAEGRLRATAAGPCAG